MRQGEPGERSYALASGEVLVEQHGLAINRLGRGDGVGETALLRGSPHTATVTARTPVVAYAIEQQMFLDVLTGDGPPSAPVCCRVGL